jgi:hypothetical protein
MALAVLAVTTVVIPRPVVAVAALLSGAAMVGWLLRGFARGNR